MSFILFTLFLATSAFEMSWDNYLTTFPDIEINHMSEHNFLENVKYIINHNQGNSSFKLGLTPFLHLNEQEWKSKFHNFTMDHTSNDIFVSSNLRSTPSSFSWVEQGKTTPVKDQGSFCGECWAASTTESMETTYAIKSGELLMLSHQQLVDCSKLNKGCNGGLQSRAYIYLEKTGQCLESEYPYIGKDGTCHSCTAAVPLLSSYVSVKNENDMGQAILITSLAVAIQADQKQFQMYSSGVLDFDCGTNLNHAVNVEGYGTENGKDYWLVRNSWGTSWGDKGYVKMARGKDLCGIAESVVYPVF